mmetsp:Transcript_67787/g.189213  ORF Transcript_67787/g.189213 Transcript_67787/m.189213 type:complete len:180 (+) Transcript_67787:138-677(+)
MATGANSAKRQRVSSGASEKPDHKVRARQILIRHAGGTLPTDPVRRKPVKRSLEEAEARMLKVLVELEADGCQNFAKVCREVSECPSSLKGGELAGDIGWIDRQKIVVSEASKKTTSCNLGTSSSERAAAAKAAASARSMRDGVQAPVPVLKAGLELELGHLSDLVLSEFGVHLIQRTA